MSNNKSSHAKPETTEISTTVKPDCPVLSKQMLEVIAIADDCVDGVIFVDEGWRKYCELVRAKGIRPVTRCVFRQLMRDYKASKNDHKFISVLYVPEKKTRDPGPFAFRQWDNPDDPDVVPSLYSGRPIAVPKPKEFDEINYANGGERRFVKLLEFDKGEQVTPDLVLSRIGCVPEEWEIVKFKTEAWEVAIRDEAQNRECRLVAVTMRPRTEVIDASDWRKAAVELFAKDILPWRLPPVVHPIDRFDANRMLEVAPIELHLGKTSLDEDTGDAYNVEIAIIRFEDIISEVLERQRHEQCAKCLLVIGNDFFNSEFTNATTNGTPQTTEGSARSLFRVGLELYVKAIRVLRSHFLTVDVMLCAGNHARNMEFFLYTALSQRFSEVPNINFRQDTKDTQAVQWGQCAIFFNHGDKNWKRTVQSIPIEFPKIWGSTKYRELHMGHLHSEQVAEEGSGLTIRRVSSPCGPDAWHYENRFIGALKRHQIFVWDSNTGLCEIYYITAESTTRKS